MKAAKSIRVLGKLLKTNSAAFGKYNNENYKKSVIKMKCNNTAEMLHEK